MPLGPACAVDDGNVASGFDYPLLAWSQLIRTVPPTGTVQRAYLGKLLLGSGNFAFLVK